MAKVIQRIFNPKEYNRDKVRDTILDMRMSRKSLERQAKNLEKLAEKSKKRVKDCLLKGDVESAKIHAESSIRNRNSAQYLILLLWFRFVFILEVIIEWQEELMQFVIV